MGAGVLVQDERRRRAADLGERAGDDARMGAVGGDHEPARIGMAVGADPGQLLVGPAQDPRQALGSSTEIAVR